MVRRAQCSGSGAEDELQATSGGRADGGRCKCQVKFVPEVTLPMSEKDLTMM